MAFSRFSRWHSDFFRYRKHTELSLPRLSEFMRSSAFSPRSILFIPKFGARTFIFESFSRHAYRKYYSSYIVGCVCTNGRWRVGHSTRYNTFDGVRICAGPALCKKIRACHAANSSLEILRSRHSALALEIRNESSIQPRVRKLAFQNR